jgi:hypothetical protein
MGLRLFLCAVLAIGQLAHAQSVVRLDDPLRDPTRLRNWDRLEGLDKKPGTANAFVRNDVTVVAGTLRTAFRQPGADALNFEATVRVFIPAQSADGTSLALLVAGPGAEQRVAATVITDQAGMDKSMCAVGIASERMECTPLKRNAWHILRIRVDEGVAEVGFRPEDGDEFKVSDLDVSTRTPNLVSHIGLSTTGTALAFRQLTAVAVQVPTSLPTILQADGVRAEINRRGRLTALHLKRGKEFDTFRFRSDKWCGPTWVIEEAGRTSQILLQPNEKTRGLYEGKQGDVSYSLQYRVSAGRLEIEAALENHSAAVFNPLSASVRMGIDTEQLTYPQWRKIPYPTFLRCEPTHAWGYAMTPNGEILGIACPDVAGSWQQLSDSPNLQRPVTFSLTAIGPGEYSKDQPAQLSLKSDERRVWRIRLFSIADLAQVPSRLSEQAGASFLNLAQNTVEPGQLAVLPNFVRPGESRTVSITGPDQKSYEIYPQNRREMLDEDDMKRSFGLTGAENPNSLRFIPESKPGTYRLRVEHTQIAKDAKGEIIVGKDGRDEVEGVRVSETIVTVQQPWSTFTAQAASTPSSLDVAGARSASPQAVAKAAAHHARQRNAGGDISELELAGALIDLALAHQPSLPSYDPAWFDVMSVMHEELREVDRPAWRARYDRHHAATQRAINDLIARLDNLPNEKSAGFDTTRLCNAAGLLAQWTASFAEAADRIRCQQAALELLRLTRGNVSIFTNPEQTIGTIARARALFLLYQQTGMELLLCEALQNLGATEPKGTLSQPWLECVNTFIRTRAYVVVRADGSYWGYHCQANRKDGILEVTPSETCVTEIHVQSRWPDSKVRIHFSGQPAKLQTVNGILWIKADK